MWHPGLRRRVSRVLSCASFNHIEIWWLDCFKNNQTYYFAEVIGFFGWNPGWPGQGGAPGWDTLYNLPHICFFLGKFPLYWVLENGGPGYASDAFIGRRWAWGMLPQIPDLYNPQGPEIFKIDRDRWIKYVPQDVIDAYLRQPELLFQRKLWVQLCAEKNYAPERPGYSLFPEPAAPRTSPLSEVQLPQPTPAAEAPAEPGALGKLPPMIYLELQEIRPDVLEMLFIYKEGA